jgi:hypothetical protein
MDMRKARVTIRPLIVVNTPIDLQLQSFNVQSDEKVLRPDGGVEYWRFNISRGQRSGERPELLGNVSLRLTGNIYVAYRREATPLGGSEGSSAPSEASPRYRLRRRSRRSKRNILPARA